MTFADAAKENKSEETDKRNNVISHNKGGPSIKDGKCKTNPQRGEVAGLEVVKNAPRPREYMINGSNDADANKTDLWRS